MTSILIIIEPVCTNIHNVNIMKLWINIFIATKVNMMYEIILNIDILRT